MGFWPRSDALLSPRSAAPRPRGPPRPEVEPRTIAEAGADWAFAGLDSAFETPSASVSNWSAIFDMSKSRTMRLARWTCLFLRVAGAAERGCTPVGTGLFLSSSLSTLLRRNLSSRIQLTTFSALKGKRSPGSSQRASAIAHILHAVLNSVRQSATTCADVFLPPCGTEPSTPGWIARATSERTAPSASEDASSPPSIVPLPSSSRRP
mmetsp:Transcript_12030/g.48454  ORF Transcript_12030/g.48454 Transcript_12030/m.48454 type:complete len:208 (-) Transcript_12030:207-830(-)